LCNQADEEGQGFDGQDPGAGDDDAVYCCCVIRRMKRDEGLTVKTPVLVTLMLCIVVV